MKRLPIGYQNIKEIIEGDFTYVDKTKQVYHLIKNGKLYFLSRPRRFGKSLLVSTLQYIFGGYQELFKGLYIAEETDYKWVKHPILHFSFAAFGHQVINLESALSNQLAEYAQQFGIPFPYEKTLAEKFKYLVAQIAIKDKPVVILIDEYDKPIVDFLTKIAQADKNRSVLKDFFSPLKDLEAQGHIRFLFITGVSKFSRVSLFSDLNNIDDLSISSVAHNLTGITHKELLQTFGKHIQHTAKQLGMSETKILTGIKLWYNGYSFEGKTRLYNPFSLLNFFNQSEFHNFWFATGTPTFLVKAIRDQAIEPKELEKVEVTNAFFEKFSLKNMDLKVLLYQTGYLTIQEVIQEDFAKNYILGYPNEEVRRSFVHNLLEAFTWQSVSTIGSVLLKMKRGLKKGDMELFIAQLKILLSDINYHQLPKKRKYATKVTDKENFRMWEGYFHSIIYLVTAFLGLEVQSEIAKHKGRIDLIAQTNDFLYLMEFKLEEPATDAIEQIKNREYVNAYKNTSKTLILVGIGFSRTERNVENWESEVWKS